MVRGTRASAARRWTEIRAEIAHVEMPSHKGIVVKDMQDVPRAMGHKTAAAMSNKVPSQADAARVVRSISDILAASERSVAGEDSAHPKVVRAAEARCIAVVVARWGVDWLGVVPAVDLAGRRGLSHLAARSRGADPARSSLGSGVVVTIVVLARNSLVSSAGVTVVVLGRSTSHNRMACGVVSKAPARMARRR